MADATPTTLDAATDRYNKTAEGKRAFDLFFIHSFLFELMFKTRKGKANTKAAGSRIDIPLRYDGNVAGYFSRGGVLSSDKREAITQVHFNPIHAYANATLFRIDLQQNKGKQQKINLFIEEVEGMKNSLGKKLSESLYDEAGGASGRLTGWGAACNEDMDAAYGGYSANQIVSDDGTKVWKGNCNPVETPCTLAHIRKQKSAARFGQWKQKQPDIITTTQAIFDYLKEMLSVQQLFTGNDTGTKCKPVAAGFTGVHFEGSDINPDEYVPEKNMFYFNSDHIGAAIYPDGDFKQLPWEYIANSDRNMTCKTIFDGNQICTNRRSLNRDSNMIVPV